jgi:tetratricopeptide (TPR) repeat protein
LRISVQLIDAADGYQVWSERYDREMSDIFALQDDITLAVVEALKLKLLGGEKAAVLKRHTVSAEAYELFLKGRYHNKKALALDPLAPLIGMNAGWTYFTAGMLDEASTQAAKMVDSDPEFYGAYWLQGAIHLSAGEFAPAVEQLRTAVSLGGHAVVVADLGSAYSLAGRREEAAAILRQLLELRQRQYVPAICLARVYSRTGDTATAIAWLETAFAERNGEMVFLEGEIAGAADRDPLHRLADDSRVAALLRRVNHPSGSHA